MLMSPSLPTLKDIGSDLLGLRETGNRILNDQCLFEDAVAPASRSRQRAISTISRRLSCA